MDSAHEKEVCIIQFAKTNAEISVQRGVLNTTGRTHHEKTGFSAIFQGCGLGESDFGSWERKAIFYSKASRPTLWPTQPSVQWVTGLLPLG